MIARPTCIVLLAALLPAVPAAAAGGGESLAGEWSRSDGETRIRIVPCEDKLCAVNTWIRDPSKGEQVGDRLVLSVRPGAPAALTGQAFDVRRGLTYSLRILLSEGGMTTRGCLVEGIACRTMSWVRLR